MQIRISAQTAGLICEMNKMHDKLVKRLGERAGAFDYDGRPDIACDYEQAADAIVELSDKLAIAEEDKIKMFCQIPRWIPVTEQLPEKNGPYLCCWKASADEKMYIARIMVWRADTGWMNAWDEPMSKYVTHWMPLPEPPEEGET